MPVFKNPIAPKGISSGGNGPRYRAPNPRPSPTPPAKPAPGMRQRPMPDLGPAPEQVAMPYGPQTQQQMPYTPQQLQQQLLGVRAKRQLGMGGNNFTPDPKLPEGMMGTMGGAGFDPVTGRVDLGSAGGSGQFGPAPEQVAMPYAPDHIQQMQREGQIQQQLSRGMNPTMGGVGYSPQFGPMPAPSPMDNPYTSNYIAQAQQQAQKMMSGPQLGGPQFGGPQMQRPPLQQQLQQMQQMQQAQMPYGPQTQQASGIGSLFGAPQQSPQFGPQQPPQFMGQQNPPMQGPQQQPMPGMSTNMGGPQQVGGQQAQQMGLGAPQTPGAKPASAGVL